MVGQQMFESVTHLLLFPGWEVAGEAGVHATAVDLRVRALGRHDSCWNGAKHTSVPHREA